MSHTELHVEGRPMCHTELHAADTISQYPPLITDNHRPGTPLASHIDTFEPTRADPIGLAGRRLSRSAKVSMPSINHNVTAVKQAAFTWREKHSTANVGAKTERQIVQC